MDVVFLVVNAVLSLLGGYHLGNWLGRKSNVYYNKLKGTKPAKTQLEEAQDLCAYYKGEGEFWRRRADFWRAETWKALGFPSLADKGFEDEENN